MGIDEIGVAIRGKRKAKKMTQAQVAEKSGLTRTAIVNIEGATAMPSLMSLYNIARALDCAIEIALVERSEPNGTN